MSAKEMRGGDGPESLFVELRRGTITVVVLMHLRVENHGYGVRQALAQVGMSLKEGTLYPMLRRLEEQGALKSRWDATGERLRKYYSLSEHGANLLEALRKQLAVLIQLIDKLEGVVANDQMPHQPRTWQETE